ncbi:MAG: DNA translocase FtsK 4TM domain-containing protein [Alphaproteobacteria bacterium]|nr:DNA translocase FtsK 4TM domain-containing protein [Alphaproteobacteria bacterium]
MATAVKVAGRRSAGKNVEQFLRRRLVELRGAAWLAGALALLLALVSFHTTDPSLNQATAVPTHNLLGLPGAYLADLLLQTLGIASLLIVAGFAIWGGRIVLHKEPPALWLRFTLLPIGIALAAAVLAALPVPGFWPLASSFGGFAGLLILDRLATLIALVGIPAPVTVAAIVLLPLAVLALMQPLCFGRMQLAWAGQRIVAGLLALARFPLSLLRRRGASFATLASELRGALGRAEERASADGPGVAVTRTLPSFDNDDEGEDDTPEAASEPRAPKVRKTKAKPKQTAMVFNGDDRKLPPHDLLQLPEASSGKKIDQDALTQNARLLESVLTDFGVKGEILKVWPGPVVTLYELEPAPGTKSSRVISLADDIARSMSAVSARVAVIPGRNVIGIELPNAQRARVYFRELLGSDSFEGIDGLPLALGKDIGGTPMAVDLAKMPHLLIAGTTGSGKSVALNTMILSLLYRLTPEQCRLILIDPKMLELSVYEGIPHLLTPVVTDPRKAVVALKWTVREMEDRYRAMSQLGVRNIANYNTRLSDARRKGEVLMRKVQTGFDSESGKPVFEDQPLDLRALPFIVVVVDEMADLMLVAGKDLEAAVQRLAQMARAAGIHLMMATQRPSVDVITGTIKANFPTRISFQVTSKIDSRTILSEQGAEQLLGQGDMLYMAGGGRITRIHGPFVSDQEVEGVVNFLKSQGEPEYLEEVTEDDSASVGGEGGGDGDGGDDLYDQAVALVARERKASTSFIQRHLQIGYNRAARIVDRMEAEGFISAANHVGKREVLGGGGESRTAYR